MVVAWVAWWHGWHAQPRNHALVHARQRFSLNNILGFFNREDALVLWEAISSFIREIMGVYYHSDNDVVEDKELQAWIKDTHDNGFPSGEGHVDHQFPQKLGSLDDLIKVLTCVVFTCSCQHAAVNFGQLEAYAFIPNAPPTMQLPPPTKKGETDMKRIMNTLPSKWQTGWHIGTMHALTRFAEDEVRIYPCTLYLLTIL